MREAVVTTEKKKGKFRFNFIDLLILAVVVILFFAFVTSLFSGDATEELLVNLYLDPLDAAQLEAAELSLPKETVLYDLDGETVFGYLESDYKEGALFMTVRVTAGKSGSDRTVGELLLFDGQKLNVRCESVRLYGVTIKEISEVMDND